MILGDNLASKYATVYVGENKICKCMQSLFMYTHRPNKHLHLQMGI